MDIDAGHLAVRRGLKMTEDDRIRREAIQQLMCQGEIVYGNFAQVTGVVFNTYFSKELEQLGELERDQLIELDTESIRVTPRGRLLLRVIAMKFDRYIGRETKNVKRFSRTI